MKNEVMKKSKKNLVIAAALITTLFAGGAAIAGGKECGDREGHHNRSAEHDGKRSEKRMERLASKLDLNDEQKTQVQRIMETNHNQMQQQFQANRETLQSEMNAVLSAEQMEKFDAMMEKRKKMHGQHKLGKEMHKDSEQ